MSRSPDQESEEQLIRRLIWVVRLLCGMAVVVFGQAYLSDSWTAAAAPAALISWGGLLVLWGVLDAKARRIGKTDRIR